MLKIVSTGWVWPWFSQVLNVSPCCAFACADPTGFGGPYGEACKTENSPLEFRLLSESQLLPFPLLG